MSQPVISFDKVSMRFTLHHQRARSLQDALVNFVHRRNGTSEEFWALRDVSFEVQPGETLGIIGQNGSGKSTVLKLISRILDPTTGKIQVNGKVSALIELGAGFHPDLTGRENIYLNGSIMGFGRKEMDRRFDQIVAFAELERFIDTPVKHYSSGMYMRLGFSVAITIDPDILIIDEVLSVGDEAFQRKCLDRIGEFRRRGKTIIFVTHALGQVEALCDRAIWLRQGQIQRNDLAARTITSYVGQLQREDEERREAGRSLSQRHNNGRNRYLDSVGHFASTAIVGIELLAEDDQPRYTIQTGETLRAALTYRVADPNRDYCLAVEVRRADGLLIVRSERACEPTGEIFADRFLSAEVEFPSLQLLSGTYEVSGHIWAASEQPGSHELECPRRQFDVWTLDRQTGLVNLPHRWVTDGVAVTSAAEVLS